MRTRKTDFPQQVGAGVDPLTRLPVRSRFLADLATHMAKARGAAVLCLLDIDKFRFLNAVAGTHAGDLALVQIAEVLRADLGPQALMGRTGDDEFAVLFTEAELPEARAKATSLMDALARYQLDWHGQVFAFSACAGLAPVSDTQTADEVLHSAMTACCAAKEIGRGSMVVADAAESLLTKHHADARMLSELQSAIVANRMRLYAQEISSLGPACGTAPEFELLVHMVDTVGTEFPPSAIIPVAEHHGLIRDIDRWVMKAVLLDHAELLHRNQNVTLSLNLSGQSLADPTLWSYVSGLFAQSSVAAARIQFEITETSAIRDMSVAMAFVQAARSLGCRVALDDFGSGLSSFAYLRTFPVDCIKIDGAFVGNVTDASSTDRAIVTAIVGVARALGLTVVAEHVDSPEILATLRQLGIDKVQGFLIAEPRPFREMFE